MGGLVPTSKYSVVRTWFMYLFVLSHMYIYVCLIILVICFHAETTVNFY